MSEQKYTPSNSSFPNEKEILDFLKRLTPEQQLSVARTLTKGLLRANPTLTLESLFGYLLRELH